MYEFNRKKIRGVMGENGTTQKKLAEILGLSEVQIYKKLANKVDFKVNELVTIINHYGMDPNYFFTKSVSEKHTIN